MANYVMDLNKFILQPTVPHQPIRIKLANFSAISLANAIIGSGLDRRPSSSRREDLNH